MRNETFRCLVINLAHYPASQIPTVAHGQLVVESAESGSDGSCLGHPKRPPPFGSPFQSLQPSAIRDSLTLTVRKTTSAILLMDSGMAPTGTGAPEGRRIDAAEFRGCQALTPETETSTHYFFAHPHNFAVDDSEVTRSIHQSVVTAFDEDRDIILAQKRSLALAPDFKMILFSIDAALSQFRWVVERRLAEESAQARESASKVA